MTRAPRRAKYVHNNHLVDNTHFVKFCSRNLRQSASMCDTVSFSTPAQHALNHLMSSSSGIQSQQSVTIPRSHNTNVLQPSEVLSERWATGAASPRPPAPPAVTPADPASASQSTILRITLLLHGDLLSKDGGNLVVHERPGHVGVLQGTLLATRAVHLGMREARISSWAQDHARVIRRMDFVRLHIKVNSRISWSRMASLQNSNQ